jgi:hypothetical protein
LIDDNIRQRGEADPKKTETSDVLLRKDKNKMELLLNPIVNAEIFKGLERNEFIFLPSYETTNTDQKILFDVGVQLQFAKKSGLLQLMKKELPHYLKDFPLECILDQEKIVEQLILFGNSNDVELKIATVPLYERLLKKMMNTIEATENPNLRKPQESQVAQNHINSLVDQEHLRISFPCLDNYQFTNEAFKHKVDQSSTKVYSLITVFDAIVKNSFNLCTDDILISRFVNIMSNYVIPLLHKLASLNTANVRKLVLGYIGYFRRLMEHTNLKDPRQVMFLSPAIKASVQLLRVIGIERIKVDEFMSIRGYFCLVFDAYLNLLVTRSEIKDIFELIQRHDKELRGLCFEVDKVLLSLEHLRETERLTSKSNSQEHISDQLTAFKHNHERLKRAVGALSFAKDHSKILDLFLQNHLQTVLLKNTVSENIDPGFNHYAESTDLLLQIISTDSEDIMFHLLVSLNSRLDSTETLGFPGSSSMVKDLTYSALMDNNLSTALFVTSFAHSSPRVNSAAYDLLFTLAKKSIDRKDLDRSVVGLLTPFIIRDMSVQARARGLLEHLVKRVKKYLLQKIFLGCFAKDKRVRAQQYSQIFRPEFFDQCLSFTPTVDFRSPADCNIYEELPPNAPDFTDPLEGIVDAEGNYIYTSKLMVFKEKEQKLVRITQAQIKSLYDLVTVAINEKLAFAVRGVALDQINEALYFYRESIALKEFCTNMIGICEENLIEFGNNRENFSMIIGKLRPLDESFMSSKSAGDLPLQNKHFPDERSIACKYLEIFNTIIHSFSHLGELRKETLNRISSREDYKGLFRALWIIATEHNIDRRYQALLTINMMYLGNMTLYENLCSEKRVNERDVEDTFIERDSAVPAATRSTINKETSANIPVLKSQFSKFYCTLFSGFDYNYLPREAPLKTIDQDKKDLIVAFIEKFISESKGPQGKHIDFSPSVNKDKLEAILVNNVLTKCIDLYTSALRKDKSIDNMPIWANNAVVGLYLHRTDFLESSSSGSSLFETYFDQMKSVLLRGEDDTFLAANHVLYTLISSREFKVNYHNSSVEQNFLQSLSIFLHEKLLPAMYEYHVDKFTEKHPVISGVFGLLKEITKLVLKTNDQRLLVIIRGFITRQSFMDFFFQLLRRYEAMDSVNTLLVSFLRWHFDLFLKRGCESKYMDAVGFLFDSALICTRTDNFYGISRLQNVIKLAHAMCSHNPHLAITAAKPIFEDVKQLAKEEAHIPPTLKTSTIAWIVSLLDHRCVKVRMICWNIVINYMDSNLLELFPSLVESSLATLGLINEATGVLTLCFYFLFKVARIVRTVDAIGPSPQEQEEEEYHPYQRPVPYPRSTFVNLIHSRRCIDIIRNIYAQENIPDSLLASATRFLIEWTSIDYGSIQNKYFHTDFLEKAVKHLDFGESTSRDFELKSQNLKSLGERANKAIVIINFLRKTTSGNSNNAKVLLKNLSILPVLLDWIDFATTVMKQQVIFEVQVSQYSTVNLHAKALERGAKELCLNALSLVETLFVETDEMFYYCLNEHEGGNCVTRKGRSLFSTLSDILTYDSGDESSGLMTLKLISRLLLKWQRGFELIDSDPNIGPIAEHLISRCMSFFKNIDYTKIKDSDYLEIITSEELLNMLAILISKSNLMKDRFLTSGLFELYINKFVQIVQSFKKNSSLITTPQEKKEHLLGNTAAGPVGVNTVISSGVKGYKGGRAQTVQMSNSILSHKPSLSIADKSVQSLAKSSATPIKTTKLHQNIRAITENSVGHIKAYIVIAKYFFHNSLSVPSSQSMKESSEIFEKSMGDLISIVNFLWAEGQFEEDLMTDLLELLVNWHLNHQYSASLFKRLIDQKYTLLPDILKTLSK